MINRQLRPDQHRIGRVPVPGVPLTAENAVIENTAGDEILAFLRNRCVGFKPGKHILEAELVPPRLHISALPVAVEKHFLLQLRLPYFMLNALSASSVVSGFSGVCAFCRCPLPRRRSKGRATG